LKIGERHRPDTLTVIRQMAIAAEGQPAPSGRRAAAEWSRRFDRFRPISALAEPKQLVEGTEM
jgi:hypothetical protein